jgi:hypothetical protein
MTLSRSGNENPEHGVTTFAASSPPTLVVLLGGGDEEAGGSPRAAGSEEEAGVADALSEGFSSVFCGSSAGFPPHAARVNTRARLAHAFDLMTGGDDTTAGHRLAG